MYRRVVVPLDGSELAETALPMAEMVAERAGAELHLVHVLGELPDYSIKMPDHDMEWEEIGTEAAAEYLEDRVRLLEERGVEGVVANVVRGEDRVAEGLERYCRENVADLVVMTTHGEGGFRRFWVGSVADETIRRTRVPVLLLRPDDDGQTPPPERFREVLVPLDGSQGAELAIDHGLGLAEIFESPLVVLRVEARGKGMNRFRADPAAAERPGLTEDVRDEAVEYLEPVAAEIRGRTIRTPSVEHEVLGARTPAEGILERAEAGGVLVMATHGRGGFTRMVVGSVADKVLRGGRTPLLLVRAPEED